MKIAVGAVTGIRLKATVPTTEIMIAMTPETAATQTVDGTHVTGLEEHDDGASASPRAPSDHGR